MALFQAGTKICFFEGSDYCKQSANYWNQESETHGKEECAYFLHFSLNVLRQLKIDKFYVYNNTCANMSFHQDKRSLQLRRKYF
jgi:hypothetical protein